MAESQQESVHSLLIHMKEAAMSSAVSLDTTLSETKDHNQQVQLLSDHIKSLHLSHARNMAQLTRGMYREMRELQLGLVHMFTGYKKEEMDEKINQAAQQTASVQPRVGGVEKMVDCLRKLEQKTDEHGKVLEELKQDNKKLAAENAQLKADFVELASLLAATTLHENVQAGIRRILARTQGNEVN